MQVLAALGDAPTAAIAIVAIVIGVLLAARGPREKRPAGAAEETEAGPTLLKVPIAPAPEVEPGFVGPEGEVVGHGPIRLGAVGPLSGDAPAPEPAPPPPPPAHGPGVATEPPAAHFRQGTIKLGGRDAGKRNQ